MKKSKFWQALQINTLINILYIQFTQSNLQKKILSNGRTNHSYIVTALLIIIDVYNFMIDMPNLIYA